MHLTRFSDYALRVLILAAGRDGARLTIAQAAAACDVSHAHLRKVVRHLAAEGHLAATRGRGGGFALARPADQINLGAVLRASEPDYRLWACQDCPLAPGCSLPAIGARAVRVFLAEFDATTLADIVTDGGCAARLTPP